MVPGAGRADSLTDFSGGLVQRPRGVTGPYGRGGGVPGYHRGRMRHRAGGVAWAALVVVVAMAGTLEARLVVRSPPPPGTRLVWDHDGIGVGWFEVRADGVTVAMRDGLTRGEDGSFGIPLPVLTPGRRVSLVVAACNESGCAESEALVVDVVAGPIRWDRSD